MDLLEVLIILLFILFPIMEGVLKRRRKPPGTDRSEREEEAEEPHWAQTEPQEPRPASDMIPGDLWEIMTGEKRERPEGRETGGGPWSTEPEEAPQPVATEEPAEDWRAEPWVLDDETERAPPESLEYEGPEAYSLETPAPTPESLERPVPSSRDRHRRFHELIDRPGPRRIRRASPLVRSLRRPEGLRQAVLMKEILDPPKGLS